jgi:hypothetical protein
MESVLRLLADPVGPQGPRQVDEAASSQRRLEAVEARTGAISGAAAARRGQRSRRTNGGKRSRPVAHRWLSGLEPCAAERPSQLARTTDPGWCSRTAQPTEPPYTDPYVRWCGRGGAVTLPPIPIGRRSALEFSGHKRPSCRGQPLHPILTIDIGRSRIRDGPNFTVRARQPSSVATWRQFAAAPKEKSRRLARLGERSFLRIARHPTLCLN